MSADAFLSKLRGVQGRNGAWRAVCPAHDSKHNSKTLSIKETGDGTVLVRCWAGCSVAEVVGAVGMDLSDLFPPREQMQQGQEHAKAQRRPFPARDIVAALKTESEVGALLLLKLANREPITDNDRKRAKDAAERWWALAGELA